MVSKGNPSPSEVGCITRDRRGNILAIGAKKLGNGTKKWNEGSNNLIGNKHKKLTINTKYSSGGWLQIIINALVNDRAQM